MAPDASHMHHMAVLSGSAEIIRDRPLSPATRLRSHRRIGAAEAEVAALVSHRESANLGCA